MWACGVVASFCFMVWRGMCARAHMCVSNGVFVRVTLLCAFCVYVVVCVRLARD